MWREQTNLGRSSMLPTKSPIILYHLRELEIASNPGDRKYIMPKLADKHHAILDIGCGIGQTFVALAPGKDKTLVGIDIDLGCLSYGAKIFDNIGFVNGTGDCLPFKDNTFDLVYSRVSLPYTNIPRALDEISRVLKKGGEVWFALHSIFITLQHLKTSILKLQLKDLIFRSYVLVNGMLLHVFGKQYAFPVNKKCESYQTEGGICKALIRAGYSDIDIDRSNGFIVTAKTIKKF